MRLRIIVPAAQVLAAVAVFGWEKVTHRENTLLFLIFPLKQILLHLNLPLEVLWWPIVSLTEWLTARSAPLRATLIAEIMIVAILLASMAMFWYLVVAELELRRIESWLRKSGSRINRLFASIALLCGGAGTFVYTYAEAVRPARHGLSHYGLWPAEIVIGTLILMAWGIAFIRLGVIGMGRLWHSGGPSLSQRQG